MSEPPRIIDAACRYPVILLFTGALVWLAVGTSFALLSQVKLFGEDLLASHAWLAYGRIHPVSANALVYGFASQAGMGIALWMVCRLGNVPPTGASLIGIAALFWNLGVLVGLIGIAAGDGTGQEGLEMPAGAVPILFSAYLTIAIGALLAFHARRERELYVSHWFLLAAWFSFPWTYATANLLLVFRPVRGATQIVINGWFNNTLRELWLTALGLAAIFYFLPKLLQRPLHSRHLAALAFWVLTLFGSWGGLYAGLPLPRWMTALSTASSLVMILAILAVAVNCYRTWQAAARVPTGDLPLLFVISGAVSYVLAGCMRAADAWPPVHDVTRLTYFTAAYDLLGVFGFVTMTFAGAIYYITPRLTQQDWAAEVLVKAHLHLAVIGLALATLSLAVAGVWQGLTLNQPGAGFDQVIRITTPFLKAASLGILLLALGHCAFLLNLGWTLIRWIRAAYPIHNHPAREAEPVTARVPQ
jgi:cytochrome c oxidase cbb3-type subunit 1